MYSMQTQPVEGMKNFEQVSTLSIIAPHQYVEEYDITGTKVKIRLDPF